MAVITSVSPVIANGQSLSNAVNINGDFIARLNMPAAWDTAVLSFRVSVDGVTFQNLYNEDGSEVTLNFQAGRSYRLNANEWAGIRWLQLRSGTSGSPVAQTADRTIVLELWS